MKNNIFFIRTIFSSIFHIIVAIIILLILDFGLYYFVDFIFFKVFFPFNELSLLWKIFLLFIGGYIIFTSIMTITQRVVSYIGGLIFERIHKTEFSELIVYGMTIINAIYNIILLCRAPEFYNFWIICELIIISSFVWKLNYIVLPAKEQMQIYRNENEM